MDAPTTTSSAGSDGSGGNSGDWGWFTPSRKPADDRRAPDQQSDERAPSRPVNPIRPVGTEADRRTPAEPAPAPGPGAGGGRPDDRRTADRRPDDRRAPGPGGHGPAGHGPAAPGPAARGREEHQRPDEVAPAPQDVRPGLDSPFAVPETASPDAILLRRTMAEVEPISDKVTSYFYALLFVQHPELRPLFPAAMDAQRDRLFKAILTAARLIDDPDILTEFLSRLGRGHRKYGTQPEHYPAVGECLIGALTRYAVTTWNDEAEAAWVRAYTAISQIMIDSAAEDELIAPAWWQAEVVGHELRTHDIAVITVRPDQPYPFLAGQYTSLETPWWPRVWRHYSFAAAPRPDGLLSFHVKAVPAGWVSSALVHRARPGDVIRLGPPAGSMTVDHASDNGLLCLGGGTGIAPIKALVEDVADHGRNRTVEVFYGARNDHDLYDIDTMLRLAQKHPWLAVRPVVSDGPTNGLSGRLPDAVRQYGPWNAFDAYLSGPPGMIRSGVDALMGVGIPSHRIRHDSIEELAAAAE